jgi:hypothetical protein
MLEIKGLTFSVWLILFSTACFANLLGLNLSSGLNSAVSIYILIPMMLVPQLLLSGVIVDFNKMHPSMTSYSRTPYIGDLMVSRWAYEALAVNQFANNDYRKKIFTEEQIKNDLNFKAFYWLPQVQQDLVVYKKYINEKNEIEAAGIAPILSLALDQIGRDIQKGKDSINLVRTELSAIQLSENSFQFFNRLLTDVKNEYQEQYQLALNNLDRKHKALLLTNNGDADKLVAFRNEHVNKKMEMLLRDKYSMNKIYISKNRILQGDEPIYRYPAYSNGTAHFYSSVKIIGNIRIKTLLFNVLIIWFFTALLMVSLYFSWLRKLLQTIERWRLLQQAILHDKIFYNPMAFIKGKKNE